ncbi:MBL fold metallo-hydrolase [Paenibacillus sp. 1001270B_150601_E10]|uniref:MBL fold metallo-hydrolase n=1 Tax=Paenibacillus sp. 1001270B_150601_E10 TaxID=2787079 RepID=UPI0018A0C068|nr:MBL fold metallo-hydrolase [Paenibacillus sp. 1001270B_150601_E10]
MRISDGIEMLELSANVLGNKTTIHPTILWDKHSAVLIDAGYPGQLSLIKNAVEATGVSFSQIHAVVLTHQDIDHIGSLPALIEAIEHPIEVLAHELECPYIQGDRMLIKVTPEKIDLAVKSLPPEVPEQMRQAFRSSLENPPKAQVTRTIAGSDILPYAGGLTVVPTPGHTPGHFSLYHQTSKTLIAGDALVIYEDKLMPSNPQHTYHVEESLHSIKELLNYDIETVICYHGGVMKDNVNERIAELSRLAK